MSILIITLVMTIPLASIYLSTIFTGYAFLEILSIIFLYNNVELLGGLYQSLLCESLNTYQAHYTSLLTLIPITYLNADANKPRILIENKYQSGIYQWIHKNSGKTYVGSAFNLSKRIGQYYSIKYLMYHKHSHIYKALLKYGYSNFHLSILEYIDIQNLSKDNIKKLLLEKEQAHINTLKPAYNILRIAGSPLGRKHSKDARELISNSRKGKYNGIYNPMFGKNHTLETTLKLSLINSGVNNPMYGKTGENNILSKKVYIYDKDNLTLIIKEFSSYTEAAKYFECHRRTIYRYIDKNISYKNKWILTSTLISLA